MNWQSSIDWLDEDVVFAIHEAQIAEHGGASGLRDRGLLASALARPQNAAVHTDAGVPSLAALYALGMIKSHPFADGNKRVGAVLLEMFLELHSFELAASDSELYAKIVAVAGAEMTEQDFSRWVCERAREVGS